MKPLNEIWEAILDKFDKKVFVTKLAKPEDLVISNASLENIKRGIRKIYQEAYGGKESP